VIAEPVRSPVHRSTARWFRSYASWSLARPDTPLPASVEAKIAGQFDLAEQRFAAILEPS
jgi:hypothetical protein